MLQVVLDNIPIRVFWKDRDGRFLGCNQLVADDAGLPNPEAVIGLTDQDMSWPTAQAMAYQADDQAVLSSGIPKIRVEEPQDRPDGQTHWLETTKVPLYDSDGELYGLLGCYSDISDRKQREQEIQHMALHDDLTGCRNRRSLVAVMAELERREDGPCWGGLVLVDIDQFKALNQALGHDIGDDLLCRVARRLESVVERRGEVFRLGGAEFVLLFATVSEDQSSADSAMRDWADRVLQVISEPLEVTGIPVFLTASAGITLIAPEEADLSRKVVDADLALNKAKQLVGTGRQFVYTGVLGEAARRRHLILNRLRDQAFEASGFRLVFQPIVLSDKQLAGAEVLLRLDDSSLGVVSPAEFIPIAEESGVMHPLGLWVLERALVQARKWQDLECRPDAFYLSINISAAHFEAEDFVPRVRALLDSTGADPRGIELEVTESLPFESDPQVISQLTELTEMGLSIALDDFGTGYSSITCLSQLPISKVKLDAGFVRSAMSNRRHRSVAQAIGLMARQLGLELVAEGIETRQALALFRLIGCRLFQGYLFDPGLPAGAFEAEYFK